MLLLLESRLDRSISTAHHVSIVTFEEEEKTCTYWKLRNLLQYWTSESRVNRWWKIMKFPCSFNRYPPCCVFARESTSIYFNFIENLPVQPKQMQKYTTIHLEFVSYSRTSQKTEKFPDSPVLDLGSTIGKV